MAIARKVIIMDFDTISAQYIYATAAVVVSLGIAYWLVAHKNNGLFDVSCGFDFIQHAPHGTADQVDHRNEIAFVSVAASPRSGSLKEAIHAFQTCVRQA